MSPEVLEQVALFYNAGDMTRAEAACNRILQANPEEPDALHYLAMIAYRGGRFELAAQHARHAIRNDPTQATYHNTLGLSCRAMQAFADAETAFQEAVRLHPPFAEAHNGLGNTYFEQGRLREAKQAYEQALHHRPDFPEAINGLGAVLRGEGDLRGSRSCFEKAIGLRSEFPGARHNLSMAMLQNGEFSAGWREYEWRWHCGILRLPDYPLPRWDGAPLRGRSILIHAEQGRGDAIQFIRYAKLLKANGAGKILAGCPPDLTELFRTCPGVDDCFSQGMLPQGYSCYAPLLSLPGLLGTTLETIPAEAPYLKISELRLRQWAPELTHPGFKVGLFWKGNPRNPSDRQRSIPLALFEPLSRIAGIKLYSLQKGLGVEQLAELAQRWNITPLGERFNSFADTAAVLSQLDLLISVDTAVVHLAGALGRPAWVLIPASPDWRWLLERDDSPWYPSLRLFRQKQPGDWPEVMTCVAKALAEKVGGRHGDDSRTAH